MVNPRSRPTLLTNFVGRASELDALRPLLRDGRRLLTLVGPGGIGKTRLALALATEDPDADVVFVDLGALADERLVDAAVLEAVSPGVKPGRTPLRAALHDLRERSAVIVLDTCEHLPAAAARVADTFLTACPRARVLATSRVPLHTRDERVWRVPPLTVGAGDAHDPSDATRLFVDRVELVRGDLVRTPETRADVERIVRALDGFPLAIELAAARTRMMTLREIADGLDLRLLAGGPTRGEARHRTMRRCLDWSHALLSDREKLLFARVSVFTDGWTADAAEAVCGDEEPTARWVRDTLAALVDKSLIVADGKSRDTRYRMLLPMRQYATGLLGADETSRDFVRVNERHVAYFAALAERADLELWALSVDRRRLIDVEMPNLRAALESACAAGSVDALRITAALGSYWRMCGSLTEGVEATGRALAAVPDTAHPARAMTLAVRSTLTFWTGDLPGTEAAATEAIEIAKRSGDRRALSHALLRLANFICITDPPLAQPMFRAAVDLAKGAHDNLALADALGCYTLSLLWQGDFPLLSDIARQALDAAAAIDFDGVRSLTLWCLAVGARSTGDVAETLRLADAMVPAVAGNAGEAAAFALTCRVQVLSTTAALRGDPHRARELALAEFERVTREPMRWACGLLIKALAYAELAAGDLDAARAWAERVYADEREGAGFLAWQAQSILMLAALASADPAGAREHAAHVTRIADRLGNRYAATVATLGTARAALWEHDPGTAEITALDALTTSCGEGWWLEAVTAAELVASAAVERAEYRRAVTLFAAVDAARDASGVVRVPLEDTYWSGRRAVATDALDEPALSRALADGAAMSLPDAAVYARDTHNPRSRASRGWESLTPTESRVALLAADGLLNPEIAEQLFVSRSTVKVHMSHILAKLGVANRTELAVLVHSRARDPHN
ncbi:helix-turn-helix transcriptional regulator [Embleya hyalina]|uniref:LuxR family transcriptional regulator n=1 Tax=Embleya hyalina TaxID=516124 RepID=A0A401YR02_9ACTN|nr:LuxR C-terminal-related transcriptional regulator [Embleya hyalina]GCD97021.1 LuxR family transcriptional regulator [Embleya hyalina]